MTMSRTRRNAALVALAEAQLVRAFGLEPTPVAPRLASHTGELQGHAVTLSARCYRSARTSSSPCSVARPGPVAYARFVTLAGGAVDIGNLLVIGTAPSALPILGADLVSVRAGTSLLAVDLTPVIPEGSRRDAQLADLAARRRAHEVLPALPAASLTAPAAANAVRALFSPHHVTSRYSSSYDDAAAAVFLDFVDAWQRLAGHPPCETRETPDRTDETAIEHAQHTYLRVHREDRTTSGVLARAFGEAFATQLLHDVMFPLLPSSRSAPTAGATRTSRSGAALRAVGALRP